MNMSYSELIEAYLTDSLTAEEELVFIRMLDNADNRAVLAKAIQDKAMERSFADQEDAARKERNLLRLRERLQLLSRSAAGHGNLYQLRKWGRWAAAAVLAAAVAGAFFWLKPAKTKGTGAIHMAQKEVPPGGNKAILTLADGTMVVLDSAGTGPIARQGNSTIVKKADGQIEYDVKGLAGEKVMINTMQTPRGGQYQLTLPDGTKVWLNSESSISYPAVFLGGERNVKITGEAYFEVTGDPRRPFKVELNGSSSIEVLGTHFNINAYADEPAMKATLLEGSIRLKNDGSSALLAPGDQAQIGRTIQVHKDADLDKVVAWKNGLFNFNHSDLPEVMRQLARWYDMDVVYDGAVPDFRFRGKLSKDLSLSQVLRILEAVDVHFNIVGKTIRVSK